MQSLEISKHIPPSLKSDAVSKPDRVRLAEPGDVGQVYDMLIEMQEETCLLSMSKGRILSTIDAIMVDGSGVIGVIGKPGKIEATIGLTMSSPWYSDQWTINDLWNLVHPCHRQSNNAKDLIGFAKWASARVRMPLLMGVVSDEKTEGKVRLFQRQLGRPLGAVFLHNLERYA